MTNIIDINSERIKRSPVIRLNADEIEAAFHAFMGFPLRMAEVVGEQGEIIGYTAAPGVVSDDPPSTPEEFACIAWDNHFRCRVFEDGLALVVTLMDFIIEQRHIAEAQNADE